MPAACKKFLQLQLGGTKQPIRKENGKELK